MAKSTRSKVKRSFRRSKREVATSAYHAIDAARLERLSAKLRSKFDDDAAEQDGDDSEVAMKDVVEDVDEAGMPIGWLDFAVFGLIDHDEISFARPFGRQSSASMAHRL